VRNRVAGSRTRSLVKRVMVAVGLLLVVTAHAAGAAQGENTLESSMPMNIAGPLGIVVAAIGLTGLLLGFWRFARKSAKEKLAAAQLAATLAAEPAPASPRTPAHTS
jgi:hypothetical protein